MLGNRADPGLNLLCRTNKRPTVLALSATTYAQVVVSPKTTMGVPQNQVSASKEGGLLYLGLLIILLINNYKLYHSFTYNFAIK